MPGLQIITTKAGRAALVNAEHNGTAPLKITQIGITAAVFTPNEDMTTLPGEIKRIDTISGETVAPDTIHVTIRDDGTDIYTVRGIGYWLSNGVLLGVYGQPEPILQKSAQSMMLLAADTVFASIKVASLAFGNANFTNPPATVDRQGVVALASATDTTTGTNATRAVTPAGLKPALALKAPLDSPPLTGAPTAPTPDPFDSSTRIPTTAFVRKNSLPLMPDIGDALNLNTFTATGIYGQPFDLQAARGTNYPAPFAGVLQVTNTTSGVTNQCYQTYSGDSGGNLYFRTCYTAAWTPWRQVARNDSPTLTGAPAAPTPATSDNSTRIATTAFLRNLLAAGGVAALTAGTSLTNTGGWHKLGSIPVTPTSGEMVLRITGAGGYSPGQLTVITTIVLTCDNTKNWSGYYYGDGSQASGGAITGVVVNNTAGVATIYALLNSYQATETFVDSGVATFVPAFAYNSAVGAPPAGTALVSMRSLLIGGVSVLDLSAAGIANFLNSPIAPTPAQNDNSKKLVNAEFVKRAIDAIPAPFNFTPVQQGTGIGQLPNNVVKIGWNTAALKATVDTTGLGNIAFESWVRGLGYAQGIENAVNLANKAQDTANYANLPAGTRMPFAQAAAPTGWTQVNDDTTSNRMLRVVNGAGGAAGGWHSPIENNVVPAHTHGFTTGTVSSGHTHGIGDPGHAHGVSDPGHAHTNNAGDAGSGSYLGTGNANKYGPRTGGMAATTGIWINSAGTGIWTGDISANHTHSGGTDNGSSQTNWTPRYIDMIICAKK